MKIINFTIALFLSGSISFSAFAQENTQSEKSFSFGASYTGDNALNTTGGIKTGYGYLGMANFKIGFNTEKAGLWPGGLFHLHAVNTHGASPSADLLGDMQVASNIEAGDHTYIQELWLLQSIGKFEFTLGLQDLNVEFVSSEYGGLFLNSSFGIMPIISSNISAPIFPLTAPGLTARWNISEKVSWLSAIYDGCPIGFDQNPYNLKWDFKKTDGVLGITEIQFNTSINGEPGIYKTGIFTHHHIEVDSLRKSTSGLYAIIDQKIWTQDQKSLGLFAQLGYSPNKTSFNNFYMGFGMNYSGLFSKKCSDILGLALAHEHFNDDIPVETAIELTYQYQLTENIFLQPDIQYIINPAGTGETLDNCLAGFLRFGITL